MTRVILVRHCEAFGNYMRVFQGHTDCDISENGQRQLDRLAERFRNISYDVIYSSPLKRALMTAGGVNRYHGLPIHTHSGLIEINGGDWEEEKWDDLPLKYKEAYEHWSAKPWLFSAPHGESMGQVFDRMRETVLSLVKQHEGTTLAVVSHGCAIRNFLCFALGKSLEQIGDVAWCDNTAVSIVDFDEQMVPSVIVMNDASHLDESTSTFASQSWWRPENEGAAT